MAVRHLYLVHHGIKGMKWGVRRYRNADGTLTEEGKQRYSKEIAKGRRDKDTGRLTKKSNCR